MSQILGTEVASPLSTGQDTAKYGTHYDFLGIGGLRTVLNITDRDAIPVGQTNIINEDMLSSGRRKHLMEVWVMNSDGAGTPKKYILKDPNYNTYTTNTERYNSLADNTKWVESIEIPSQTDNSGKFLTTNGTSTSWGVIDLSNYIPYGNVEEFEKRINVKTYNLLDTYFKHVNEDTYYDASLRLRGGSTLTNTSATLAATDGFSVSSNLIVNPGGIFLNTNAGKIGFFQSAGAIRATILGDLQGNSGLSSLLSALSNYGLIINSTTLGASGTWKAPAMLASTANHSISSGGTQTVDGVLTVSGQRILLKDQTNATENGIYLVNTVWTRASDLDSSEEIPGSIVYVTQGNTNAGKVFKCTNSIFPSPTMGTSNINFAEFGAAGTTYTAGTGINITSGVVKLDISNYTTSSAIYVKTTSIDGSYFESKYSSIFRAYNAANGWIQQISLINDDTDSTSRFVHLLSSNSSGNSSIIQVKPTSIIFSTNKLGFFGGQGVVRPTITGIGLVDSLKNLLIGLSDLGLIINSTDNTNSVSAWKQPVHLASTVNVDISLVTTQTIDGVGTVSGQRVLLKNQTNAVQNGIYITNAGVWSRATDFDSSFEDIGAMVLVTAGTTNAGKVFRCTSAAFGGTSIGTSNINFVEFPPSGGGTTYTEGSGIDITSGVVSLDISNYNTQGSFTIKSTQGLGNITSTLDLKLTALSEQLYLGLNNGFGYNTLILNTLGTIYTQTGFTTGGIQYGSDYSSGYTLRSLVDKEYVDSQLLLKVPSQTNNSGKYLTTNGTTTSWATVSGGGITSPLTTKGDIFINNGLIDTRLPLGAENFMLVSKPNSTLGLSYLSLINLGKVIYISPSGDDTTGSRSSINLPFLTLTAAKLVYQAGDLFWWLPGNYTGQSQLGINGSVPYHYTCKGADITFATDMLDITSGGLVLRGNGTFTGGRLSAYSTSANAFSIIDLEYDKITLTSAVDYYGSFSLKNVTEFRLGGKKFQSNNVFYISDVGSMSWTCEDFSSTLVGNEGSFFINIIKGVIKGVFNCLNHKINLVSQFVGGAYPIQDIKFSNCFLNVKRFGTATGAGFGNSFKGTCLIKDTKITASEIPMEFRKIETDARFQFDGAILYSGTNTSVVPAVPYPTIDSTIIGTEHYAPNIEILRQGGLLINNQIAFHATREITNLIPYTCAIRIYETGITPLPSSQSGIKVTGEPVFTEVPGYVTARSPDNTLYKLARPVNGGGNAVWEAIIAPSGSTGIFDNTFDNTFQ